MNQLSKLVVSEENIRALVRLENQINAGEAEQVSSKEALTMRVWICCAMFFGVG